MTEIKVVFDALKNKQSDYNTRFAYYEGNQPLKYSAERLKRALGKTSAYFAQNWVGVVITSILDRIGVKSLSSSKQGKDELEQMFKTAGLGQEIMNAIEAALVTKEGFVIVDVVDGELEAYENDPRMVHVEYDPSRPKQKLFAGKKWFDAVESKFHITLYYPDRIEDWVSDKGATPGSFQLSDTVSNELGIIPVFHFRSSKRTIELDKAVLSLQDGINLLFSNMMAASEYEAFKWKVFLTEQDPGEIKIGPDMSVWIPTSKDGGSQDVKELGGSMLDNFTKAITDLANSISATSKTPKHYFFSTGDVPSGEALIAMESPLVKKVMKYQEAFAPTLAELGQFLLKLKGIEVTREDIVPVWVPAETTQPLTQAQTMKTYTEAQVPVDVAAEKVGWTPAEVEMLVSIEQNQSGATPE